MKRIAIFFFAIILILTLTIGLVYGSNLFFREVLKLSDDVFVGFLSLVAPAIVYIAIIFGFKEWVDAMYYRLMMSDKCRILVIGRSGSGKSTLIDSMLTGSKPYPHESTVDFSIHENLILLDLKNSHNSNTPSTATKKINKPIRVPTIIADYRGQALSQITDLPEPKFFGVKRAGRINCILLLVDFFSRDDKGDESLLARHAHDAEKQIEERILHQNLGYFGDEILEIMFDRVFSQERTYYVGIVINKIDLLRELVLCGYLKVSEKDMQSSKDIYKYASRLVEPIEERVREFCEGRGLKYSQVPTHFISGSTGENVNQLLGEILGTYQKEEDARHGRQKRA